MDVNEKSPQAYALYTSLCVCVCVCVCVCKWKGEKESWRAQFEEQIIWIFHLLGEAVFWNSSL